MSVERRTAVVIPCFNHGKALSRVLPKLGQYGLPVYVVDDGSNAETKEALAQLAAEFPFVTVITREANGGKGAAVMTGARAAAAAGCDYFLQIDSDGQHNTDDIPKLLALSRAYPNDVISAKPLYDASVPKGRLYGRYVTHFWVWIETRSFEIEDSMMGFRVYPVKPFMALIEKETLGERMDFDIEVLVRLYWSGVRIRFMPSRVIYPEGGLSHFDAVKDNIRISKMHSMLFFESLGVPVKKIAPLINEAASSCKNAFAGLKKGKQEGEEEGTEPASHWSRIKERRGLYGMKALLWLYRTGGRSVFRLCLKPVIFSYWLLGKGARTASREYLARLAKFEKAQGNELKYTSSLAHFNAFGEAILDKLAAWDKDSNIGGSMRFVSPEAEAALTPKEGDKGCLLLVSHLGVSEVCRAVAEKERGMKVHALVFLKHSPAMKQMLEEVARESQANLIAVDEISMTTASCLSECIERGEWVAIAADRTPVTRGAGSRDRTVSVSFLGENAPFPIGPYVLASLLKCPVKTLFAVREGDEILLDCADFAERVSVPRKNREEALERYAQQYAAALEDAARRHPYSWFNFYDFWKK
jgi:predicted LPLAT superfamily acyltransferase/glycosyltransferase involved in cell wall biosynthesis